MEINAALAAMADSVQRDTDGELALGWRIRLWSLMTARYGSEASFRRNVLAYLVARDLLPIWEAGGVRSDCPPHLRLALESPKQALDACKRFLQGRLSLSETQDRLFEMQALHSYIKPYLLDDRMIFAYLAVADLIWRLSGDDDAFYEYRNWFAHVWNGDEYLRVSDSELLEVERCEVHYWAAEASYYGVPWKEGLPKKRAFWMTWIQETVPKVLGPLEDVARLVE